jgi:peptidylprolyl isomerase
VNVVRSSRAAALIAAATLLIITGCGGDSDSDTATGSQVDTVAQPAPGRRTATGVIKSRPRPPALKAHPNAVVDQLIIKDIVVGRGPELRIGDEGTFDFLGAYYDTGRPLDSSWGRRRPYSTVVDHGVVIPGWAMGVPGMRVGGRRLIIFPGSLGFRPPAPSIRLRAPLQFLIDLRGVRPAQPGGSGGGGAVVDLS